MYSRVAPGGAGEAKTSGIHTATILAILTANNKAYSQVLWLDAKEHRFVEETGTNSTFFLMNNKLITPPLAGTIPPGIKRKFEGIESESLIEAFGAEMAAVVSPVRRLGYNARE